MLLPSVKHVKCYQYSEDRCGEFVRAMRHLFGSSPFGIGIGFSPFEHFTMVDCPQEAECFFVPWNVGMLVDRLGSEEAAKVLALLPHYANQEHRHVLFDFGDSSAFVPSEALCFKVSTKMPHPPHVVPFWYQIPAHVHQDTYVWSFENHRYDVCFIGADSNILRSASCASVKRCEDIRSCIELLSGRRQSNVYYPPAMDVEEQKVRQKRLRDVLKTSKISLCPPGVGPQSIRFYESLYYGKIPLIFYNERMVMPFDTVLDYRAFTCLVHEKDVLSTGEIVREFLRSTSEEKVRDMSLQACKVYHRYFSAGATYTYVCGVIARHVRPQAS